MRRFRILSFLPLSLLAVLAAVAIGAFAAHGVSDPVAKDWLKTGATYEFMHAMATFACATFMNIGAKRARFAPAFFLGGTVLFSGSLYALALGGPHWLVFATPLGGLGFLIGWAVLAWSARGVDQTAA